MQDQGPDWFYRTQLKSLFDSYRAVHAYTDASLEAYRYGDGEAYRDDTSTGVAYDPIFAIKPLTFHALHNMGGADGEMPSEFLLTNRPWVVPYDEADTKTIEAVTEQAKKYKYIPEVPTC